jgi:hypothetical protein
MFGSKFSPRLESLDARLCLSTTGGEVMAVDMFKPGEEVGAAVDYQTGDEAGLIGLLRVGEEQGAVDMFRTGEERAAVDYFYPTDQFGGPYIGASGWDKQP